MIEEPERGIHPQAIEQLSLFFREYANDKHLIFISTHNESFVRNAKPEELFFVVKEDGQTHFRLGRDAAKSVEGMPNDKAWLQNMFDGGLPW
jgi:predicted ATPase